MDSACEIKKILSKSAPQVKFLQKKNTFLTNQQKSPIGGGGTENPPPSGRGTKLNTESPPERAALIGYLNPAIPHKIVSNPAIPQGNF